MHRLHWESEWSKGFVSHHVLCLAALVISLVAGQESENQAVSTSRSCQIPPPPPSTCQDAEMHLGILAWLSGYKILLSMSSLGKLT